MSFTKSKIALALGVATALVSGVAVSSAYAVETNGSDQALYQYTSAGVYVAPGTALAWTRGAIGVPNKTGDIDATFPGSADADDVRAFISPRGQERTPSAWIANAPGGFMPGTKEVLQPNISPNSLTNGNAISVKNNGGQYSIGFAFVNNNGLSIATAGVVYHYITVTAGTGEYTFEDTAAATPTTPPVGSADINLSATTIAAADGTLSLDVPANSTAAIGNAALVNNLSTSTGVLGDFTVKDSRVLTHKGWTLTSTVADFVAGTSTIPAGQLTVTPKVVRTTAAGVTTSAASAAATTAKPFAEAGADATVGDTVLNADLTFVAPATAAAGTYTSKMTLTLVSK
jgi:hypothetical protein